jgi:hypothetical protein
MTSITSNLNYSRSQTIGCGLKKPLFKLLSHVAIAAAGSNSMVARVAKVAAHSFLAILLIIPASGAFLLGKAITHFSKTKINLQNIHLAAPPIEIPEEGPANGAIDLRVLVQKYDQLPNVDRHMEDGGSKSGYLNRLCVLVNSQAPEIFPNNPNKRREFCQTVSLFLKAIIRKMNDGEISEDKQREILLELTEASTRCYPTWLAVSAKLFAEVCDNVETVQVKLLRHIQDYKETLILHYGQNSIEADWHVLSYMRNMLGAEFGLDTSLNQMDPYGVGRVPSFGKSFCKWILLQLYGNSNHLVSRIQDTINSQDFDPSYHDFLKEILRNQGNEEPDDYVTENFFDEDYKITFAGVCCMLKSMGILT